MEAVYEGTRKQEILKYIRECGKVSGLVEIVGSVHEGHKELIKKAKERCDIICVEFLRFWARSLYELRGTRIVSLLNPFVFERDFVSLLKSIENVVDYVFCSELNERILEEQNYIK